MIMSQIEDTLKVKDNADVPVYVTKMVHAMIQRLAVTEDRTMGGQVAQLVKAEYRSRGMELPDGIGDPAGERGQTNAIAGGSPQS